MYPALQNRHFLCQPHIANPAPKARRFGQHPMSLTSGGSLQQQFRQFTFPELGQDMNEPNQKHTLQKHRASPSKIKFRNTKEWNPQKYIHPTYVRQVAKEQHPKVSTYIPHMQAHIRFSTDFANSNVVQASRRENLYASFARRLAISKASPVLVCSCL